jgi:uncharacterized protein YqjF (DUF2071 family)
LSVAALPLAWAAASYVRRLRSSWKLTTSGACRTIRRASTVPLRAQVHHVPYPAHRAEVIDVQDELVAAAGLPAVSSLPMHVHYSPGVDVEVFALERV